MYSVVAVSDLTYSICTLDLAPISVPPSAPVLNQAASQNR
jgi:hypothetical protein